MRIRTAGGLAIVVATAVAVAGCPPFPAVRCSDENPCPSGYDCNPRGLCVAPDAASAIDAGTDAVLRDTGPRDQGPGRDRNLPDRAGQDLLGVDLALPDAGPPPAVELLEVSAFFPHVYRGERGLPLRLRWKNNTDAALQLYNLQLVWSRAADQFTWQGRLPRPLPPGATTETTIHFGVGETIESGDVAVDVFGVVFDEVNHQALTAGPAPAPGRFSIEETPLADMDGDHLSDQVERSALHTDPTNPDSDGDGLDDDQESPGGSPVDSDQDGQLDALDEDSDNGLEPDLIEARRGSDPTFAGDDLVYREVVVDVASDTVAVTMTTSHHSLRQALYVANTDGVPTRIRFDLTGPIAIDESRVNDGSVLPALTESDTFVDGRTVRGRTTIAWDAGAGSQRTLWRMAASGLTLREIDFDLTSTPTVPGNDLRSLVFSVEDAVTATLAHLAFEIRDDPQRTLISLADIGWSENVFIYDWQAASARSWPFEAGVQVAACRALTVKRSRFEVLASSFATGGCDDCLLEENYFSGNTGAQFDSGGTTLRGNQIVGYGWAGVLVYRGPLWIEDNDIHDSDVGITIERCNGCAWPVEGVQMRRNRIHDVTYEAIAIETGLQGGIQPPQVTAIAINAISGSHGGADGTIIDVFTDPADEASVFVGTTVLQTGSWTLLLERPLASPLNVTATATDASGNTSALAQPLAIP